MRLFNKKGTEKPIEIFIALFIILAVSMVMLKMFQSQIKSKTADMQEYDQETALAQAKDEATNLCKAACTRANDDDCTDRAKAAYCIKKLDSLDLDGDLQNSGFDESFLGGMGICEDAIYCPHVLDCTCGVILDFENCKKILVRYWGSAGINGADCDSKLTDTYIKGSCTVNGTKVDTFWRKIYFDAADGTITCT